jgi:hypothetical protein
VVWEDPANEAIRARRASKDVLYPGDVIYLPDPERHALDFTKGTTNRYTADVPKRTLRVALSSADGPYANEAYVVEGLPTRRGAPAPSGSTGPAGEVSLMVPLTLREVGLRLPGRNLVFRFAIGEVDPLEEPTGVAKRLENLGYLERGLHDAEDVGAALRAFQRKHNLETTGTLDAATSDAGSQGHGATRRSFSQGHGATPIRRMMGPPAGRV